MRAMLALAAAIILSGCTGPGVPPTPTPTPPPPPPPPPSEFLVSGSVADSASRTLAGATVKVMTGLHAGLVTTTDDQGNFSIDRLLESNAQLIASKPGHVDEPRLVSQGVLVGGKWLVTFRLRSPNANVNLTGHHRITFTADSSCADLPVSVRTRTYFADIFADVTLSGAKFPPPLEYLPWGTMWLNQFEDYAEFPLEVIPILELLSDDAFVLLRGHVRGMVNATDSTLTFAGSFGYCPRMIGGEYPTCAVAEVTCQSSTHRMTLERR